jgi:hypothetical protein
MARNRSVSPPPEFSEDGKVLWRAAVRQLQEQGTWRAVDGPLLESYVQLVLSARAARLAGQHDTAATAEDRAAQRAAALMLTPETRRHAPNGKPRTSRATSHTGLIEASSSSSVVA